MDSTFTAQLLSHIVRGCIERVSRAKSSGKFKLLRGNVDRGHLRAQSSSELHCKVSQAAYAENSQALTRHNPGALQCAIDCESSTKKRGGFERRKTIWNLQRVSCRRLHKFRVATIHGDTRDLLPAAQVLVSFTAEFELTTAPVKPRHSDAVADLQIVYCFALFHHVTGNFVAENQRSLHDFRQLCPIPIRHVQVGMACSTGFHLDQNFVSFGMRPFDFLDRERLLEIVQDSGLHLLASSSFSYAATHSARFASSCAILPYSIRIDESAYISDVKLRKMGRMNSRVAALSATNPI